MGMHWGLIAVKAPMAAVQAAFEELGGRLVVSEEVRPLEAIEQPSSGAGVGVIEVRGATLVFDAAMLLTFDDGLAEALARSCDADVVVFFGETVSGTFQFFHATPAGLKRGYIHSHSERSEAWSYGTPLACERHGEFDETLDGEPFFEALVELGFPDIRPVLEDLWLLGIAKSPDVPDSAHAREIRAHAEAHQLEEAPPIQVVMRPASTAPDSKTNKPPEPSGGLWN